MKSMTRQITPLKKISRSIGRLLEQPRRAFLIKTLPKNSIGAEVGVHKADFSVQLLQGVNPKELHLIDPWKHEDSEAYKSALYGGKAQGGQAEMDDRYLAVCARFEKETQAGRVKIHRGFSADVLNQFPDEYFDWIYIDGNHRYEFVKADLEISLRKTKPNGNITGDDYARDGWWQGGVKKAVDEFIQEKPVELLEIWNGQFIMQKQAP